jgi:hypothetical protein
LTDPSKIYEGEQGFNINFASTERWGKALYFTTNAKDSCDNFAFTDQDGSKQVILAEVLLGDSIELPQNKDLKEPSKKANGDAYDSVKGSIDG